MLLAVTTVISGGGDWHAPDTWDNGVPTMAVDAVVPVGNTVWLSGVTHEAKSLLVEGAASAVENDVIDKTLSVNWILVDGGAFSIGSSADPYDSNTFTITLEGDNPTQDLPSVGISSNDAFLMTRSGGTLELFGEAETSWTQLGATTDSLFATSITLKEEVTWDVGDEIVIASTSSSMNHTETRVITSVSPDQKTFGLDSLLLWQHYGELQYYDNGKGTIYELDERAEVGLLSRNIKIQGDADSAVDGIGGHLMFMASSGPVAIDGVELYHMGQKGLLGRYPVHWHLAGNRDGDFVKNTSIHRSFNRAVVIHAAHNVLVEQTVAYDHIGSGYFLENAVETGNKLYYNLGLVTREPAAGEELLPTDLGPKLTQIRGPGTFWITNPDNEFVGNVAGGSQSGSGFWYALPNGPLNQSKNDPQYAGVNPQTTALRLFQGNRAHSNAIGLDVDGGPDVNTGEALSTHYNPPTDAIFSDFTAFANDTNGVYLRGTHRLKLSNARLANNWAGTMFAFQQTVSDSLIVGVSDNEIGGVTKHGFAVYDGPNTVRNVHFAGFNHPGAGLFRVVGAANRHTNHIFEEITFDNPATPLTFPTSVSNNTLARHWGFSLYDADGTLTGAAGQSVIYDHPMMRSDGDIKLPTWQNAAVSQRQFGHLKLNPRIFDNLPITTISRTGGPGADASHTDVPVFESYVQIGLVMNTDFVYTVNYDTTLNSNRIDINVEEVQGGDYFYVRVNTPWAWARVSLASAMNSEQEVRDSSSSAYYINPSGNVFVKAVVSPGLTSDLVIVQQDSVPVNPPLPSGDFNGDGDVDGHDFLTGQRGFNKPLAFEIDGDADGDFDVDSTDLGTWENQFGSLVATATGEIAALVVENSLADEPIAPSMTKDLNLSLLSKQALAMMQLNAPSLSLTGPTTATEENQSTTSSRAAALENVRVDSLAFLIDGIEELASEHSPQVTNDQEQPNISAWDEVFARLGHDESVLGLASTL